MVSDKSVPLPKKNNRVVIATNTLPPYRIALFKELQKSYLDLHVIVDSRLEFGRYWENQYENLNVRKVFNLHLKKIREDYGQFNFPLGLLKTLFSLRPGTVISSEFGFRSLCCIIYSIAHPNTSLILWVGLSEHTEKKIGYLRVKARKWMCKRADAVYATGTSGMKYITTLNPNVKLINSHQASSLSRQILEQNNSSTFETVIRADRINLLFVGPCYKRKNLDGLFALIKKSRHSEFIKDKVNFVLVAVSPEDCKQFVDEGFSLTLVPFLEHAQMPNLYKSVDALVFPTLMDEWGLVVNEALTFGCPVIGSKYSQAVQDLLCKGGGWIFDPLDQESFDVTLNEFFDCNRKESSFTEVKKQAMLIADAFTIKDFAKYFEYAIEIAQKNKIGRKKSPVISVVIPYLNLYRKPFIEQVAQNLREEGVTFNIFMGKPTKIQKTFNDSAKSRIAQELGQVQIPFIESRIVMRRIPWRIFKSNLIIYDQGLGNLDMYIVLLLCKLSRKKFAFWGHGYTITKETSNVYKRIQARLTSYSDWYFAYTGGSAERAKQIGVNKEKITILNNTTGILPLEEVNAVFERRSESTSWDALYLGAISKEKKFEELENLVNKIVEKEPQFRLLIAGAGSIGNVNLSLIKSKNIVQLGFISDERKLELAQHCRIIINPGRIGLNAIDSLALALPIVGLKNSHHAPEYEYLNSRNSFLVDSYDEMILTVHNLMQDDTQLLNKAIQCVQDAQQYQLEYMVDNFVRGTLKAVSN